MEKELNNEDFSSWAKFSIIVAGYRFFIKGKPVNKHRVFSVVSRKFNLTKLSPKTDSKPILDFLKNNFTVKDADGWQDGRLWKF